MAVFLNLFTLFNLLNIMKMPGRVAGAGPHNLCLGVGI